MYRVRCPVAYVSPKHSRTHSSGLTGCAKAARCTEIFAALSSADGYCSLRREIGSDPVVCDICVWDHPSDDERPLGTCHVFDLAGPSYLECVPSSVFRWNSYWLNRLGEMADGVDTQEHSWRRSIGQIGCQLTLQRCTRVQGVGSAQRCLHLRILRKGCSLGSW